MEAIKDNLAEFNELYEKISRIVEEVKMMATVEEDVVSSYSDLARSRLSATPQQTTSSSDVDDSIVSVINSVCPAFHGCRPGNLKF